MLQKLKNYFSERIFSIVIHYENDKKKASWKNFTSLSNIHIHDTFSPQDKSIFKGDRNDYGKIIINENFSIRDYCNILVFPKAELNIGKNVFFNNYCSINCLEKIDIGDNTIFGEGVKLYDHNHLIERKDTFKISREHFTKGAISIGKNCWIASNVTILKGVTIGDNCIIGAGCIIHRSVAANSVVKSQQNLIIDTLS